MKRLVQIISFICTLMLFVVTVAGCGYSGYRGKYKGAYTLIYSQVPDMYGASMDGAFMRNPQLFPLESDGYGRTMYLYMESTDGFLSAGIVQKETDDTVYFYPEQSTISFRLPDNVYDLYNKEISEDRLTALFYELCPVESLEAFKADNDWNTAIVEEKLDSAPIDAPTIAVRWGSRKDSVNLLNSEWEEQVFALAEKNGHQFSKERTDSKYFSHVNWMATDNYGRRLYYVEGYYYLYGDENVDNPHCNYTRYYLEMVAIINPDKTFLTGTFMVELTDKANYQEQIKALKLANGWDTPLQ